MKSSFLHTIPSLVLSLAVLLLIGSFGYVHLWQGLMWDEVTSFYRYTFVPFGTTVTKYPDPNNHIAFNLYQNVLTRITGSRNLLLVIEWIPFYRFCQLLFALLTFRLTFLLSRKLFDQPTAWLAVIILASTLPFTNFFMQLRGYNLGMLFVVGLLYCSWAYYLDGKKRHAFGSIVFPFLLVYTIPSNAYVCLSIGCFWAGLWLQQYLRTSTSDQPQRTQRLFLLLIALGIAAGLLLLAYWPVLDQLLHNRFITRVPSNRFYVLQELLPQLSIANLSGRWLLLPLAGLGFFFSFKKRPLATFTLAWCALVGIYCFTFFISFVRNDWPLQRTFSVLTPIFAIILAYPVAQLIRSSSRQPLFQFGGLLSLYFYCALTAWFEHQKIQVTLQDHYEAEIRDVSIYHNYYQSNWYQPQQTARLLKTFHQYAPHPVLLFPNELDQVTFAQYLKKQNIKSYLFRRFRANKQAETATSFPYHAVIQCVDQAYPNPLGKFNKFPVQSNNKGDQSKVVHPFSHTLHFANQENTVQQYYVVTSFHHQFEKWYEQSIKEEYSLQQLSSPPNAFYLLTKKTVNGKR